MGPEDRPVSHRELIEALAKSDILAACANALPRRSPNVPGRPTLYSPWAMLLYGGVINVFTTARKTEANLPTFWKAVRRWHHKRYPTEPKLPRRPPQRHHWQYFKKTVGAQAWEQVRDTFRDQALAAARELGLLDPDGPGSFTHPVKERLVYGDGVVTAPLSKHAPGTPFIDKNTGEVVRIRRSDPDADVYYTGGDDATVARHPGGAAPKTGRRQSHGKNVVRGLKVVFLAARAEGVHRRILLDFAPGSNDEMKFLLNSLDYIAPRAPGLLGVAWDLVPRGTHIDQIGRSHGLHVISPVMPDSGGHTTGKEAVYNPWTIAETVVRRPDGTTNPCRIVALKGQAHILELNSAGKPLHIPLDRAKNERRQNADGTWRPYAIFSVPTSSGGGTIRLSILSDPGRPKENRAEHLRSIPPDDGDYKNLYGVREDAESRNSGYKDTLWGRRAHSYGIAGHQLDWLGWALLTNGLAVHLHRSSRSKPRASGPTRPTPSPSPREARTGAERRNSGMAPGPEPPRPGRAPKREAA